MKNLFDMQYNDSRRHHHDDDGGENCTGNDLIIRTRTRRWRLTNQLAEIIIDGGSIFCNICVQK